MRRDPAVAQQIQRHKDQAMAYDAHYRAQAAGPSTAERER